MKFHAIGDAPVTTKYSSFTGGFGIIAAIVGFVGLFIDAIPDLVPLALDGLSGVFFLAGGIAWAVGLKDVKCVKDDLNLTRMLLNGLLNLGSADGRYGVAPPGSSEEDLANNLLSNCQKGLADEVFQFLGFALAAGLIGVGYVRMRKGGTATSYV